MAVVFYLVLAFASNEVPFSLGWFIVALLFSSNEAHTVYKYTTDPRLDGETVPD